MIKILKISPGKDPETKLIEKGYKSFQKEVDGLIDVIRITDNIDLIVNDEFLLNGSEISLIVNKIGVCGDCFFVKHNGQEYVGIDTEDLSYLLNKIIIFETWYKNLVVYDEQINN